MPSAINIFILKMHRSEPEETHDPNGSFTGGRKIISFYFLKAYREDGPAQAQAGPVCLAATCPNIKATTSSMVMADESI